MSDQLSLTDYSVEELRQKITLYHEALSAIAHSSLRISKQGMANLAYTTIEIGRVTCHDCSDKYDCDYAWDAYNTNGDCLASK
jgi:uncharacterized protein (UPF0212 family)